NQGEDPRPECRKTIRNRRKSKTLSHYRRRREDAPARPWANHLAPILGTRTTSNSRLIPHSWRPKRPRTGVIWRTKTRGHSGLQVSDIAAEKRVVHVPSKTATHIGGRRRRRRLRW